MLETASLSSGVGKKQGPVSTASKRSYVLSPHCSLTTVVISNVERAWMKVQKWQPSASFSTWSPRRKTALFSQKMSYAKGTLLVGKNAASELPPLISSFLFYSFYFAINVLWVKRAPFPLDCISSPLLSSPSDSVSPSFQCKVWCLFKWLILEIRKNMTLQEHSKIRFIQNIL